MARDCAPTIAKKALERANEVNYGDYNSRTSGGRFGHERRFWTELSAGMGTEALVGAGAVILAIVGLAGLEAFYMAAIATIAVGAAFLLEGAVLMVKQAEMDNQ